MGLLDDQTQKAYYEGSSLGTYQFISLDNIINNFILSYTGEDNLIPRVKTSTVAFHAQRALQELSYDTFKSIKAQEIEVPSSLTMILPQDYVNYVKIVWSDSAGIEHVLYPAMKTSNPTDVTQDANGDYTFTGNNLNTDTSSTTWDNYSSSNPSENQDRYDDDFYVSAMGQRYGIEPSHAQGNGSFFIDENTGKIHFSSNINGKTVILKYISDSLGTDSEMQVHKFAEEAMYKWIAYGILSTRVGVPEGVIMRLRKDKSVETRRAKIRLSNIKLEEITQTLRNMSKIIKH
tara:strand:+ start:1726 stop:2595 length:870 start_codon:yes stop_codon:yes gene_type:complete